MLRKLFIKNYALIDTLDVDFDEGLNILTGETGAGKSIIMGALGLILGNRAEGRHFFDENAKCIIEGHFEVSHYDLQDFFAENDLDFEADTIIRREISPEGKSRAFVNDSPVNLQVLKLLSERLIDIHSQHATLQINTPAFQLLVLDSVADNQALLGQYKQRLQAYKAMRAELQELEDEIAQANTELDYNQFVFNELEEAQLVEDELESLETEQQQLENAEDIKRALMMAHHQLEGTEYPILNGLKDALNEVQRVSPYLPNGDELAARLNSTYIELKDIADELSQKSDSTTMDEKRLQDVSERISTLYNLTQKYRVVTVRELIAFKDSVAQKIRSVSDREEDRVRLQKETSQLDQETRQLAEQLSERRQSVVETIKLSVERTLSQVGMPNAQLQIDMERSDQFGPSGTDKVTFLFSANKGQVSQPIHKVASGGELSRVMLSIKSLIARSSSLPTIIFDEIDTGISGEVSLRVGEVMESLAEHIQVIAITHLPQIASKGRRHFKVYKEDTANRTLSRIGVLDNEQRVLEIAKMLSGDHPGDAAMQHARELIGG